MPVEVRQPIISTVRYHILIAYLLGSLAVTVTADTSSFAPSGSMSAARDSASGVLLNEGNALFFGDDTGAPPELYDAATGSFSAVAALDDIRAGAAGVLLNDGRVLLVGGWNGVV